MSVPFDTLKLARKLEAAGFTRQQAEALVYVLVDMISNYLRQTAANNRPAIAAAPIR
ncbi:MAG: coiled-coil domain-containing protein [Rhodomicrobium sp.]